MGVVLRSRLEWSMVVRGHPPACTNAALGQWSRMAGRIAATTGGWLGQPVYVTMRGRSASHTDGAGHASEVDMQPTYQGDSSAGHGESVAWESRSSPPASIMWTAASRMSRKVARVTSGRGLIARTPRSPCLPAPHRAGPRLSRFINASPVARRLHTRRGPAHGAGQPRTAWRAMATAGAQECGSRSSGAAGGSSSTWTPSAKR